MPLTENISARAINKICSIRPLSLSSFMMRHGDIYPLVYIKVSELLLICKNSCWKRYCHSFYYLCSWCTKWYMEYLWIQSCILFKRQTEEAIKPKLLLKHLMQDSFEWIIICEKNPNNKGNCFKIYYKSYKMSIYQGLLLGFLNWVKWPVNSSLKSYCQIHQNKSLPSKIGWISKHRLSERCYGVLTNKPCVNDTECHKSIVKNELIEMWQTICSILIQFNGRVE